MPKQKQDRNEAVAPGKGCEARSCDCGSRPGRALNGARKPLNAVRALIESGIGLSKCRKCGCMRGTLAALAKAVPALKTKAAGDFSGRLRGWQSAMQPVQYSCFGCARCIPALAANIFNRAFPDAAMGESSCDSFDAKRQTWPPVPGEYFVIKGRGSAPVAVTTLGSADLAAELASLKPSGLRIVGKTETENIGIDKIVKNTITNPSLRYLIAAGRDARGHKPGRTLLCLHRHGVDDKMRVCKSPAPRPVLKNVSRDEVEAFRNQIRLVDMIGCVNAGRIEREIGRLAETASCGSKPSPGAKAQNNIVPVVRASASSSVRLDKAGYFVILPVSKRKIVSVEHYSYDNKLLRVIEGRNAREIYLTLVENGWLGALSHAAYMGKELARAELAMRTGGKYVQDGA